MLEELSVTNYALIDDIQVSFSKGLNILTGETGAGKSLLVGALGLIFGKKGNPSYVRQGCDEANISALVDISGNHEAQRWLLDAGITYEDDQVLIKRNIKNSGRGSQYIQGQGIIRSQLEEFSSLLFDMHGQHEHQSLFSKVNHRKLLDKYGGLNDDVLSLYNKFQEITKLRADIADLEEEETDLGDKLEELNRAIKEIDSAALYDGEEEEIEKDLKLLRNTDKLCYLIDEALSFTNGAKGIVQYLKNLTINIDSLSHIDDVFTPMIKRVKDSYYEMDDINESISDYKRMIDFSPEQLNIKEQRLSEIFKLEKKYGATIKDVLDYSIEAKKEIDKIEGSGNNIEALKGRLKLEQEDILQKAKLLSEGRSKFAKELENRVVAQLKQLSLPNVRFVVDLAPRKDSNGKPSCGPWGMDEVEFLMSMNPGEPLKPVKQIASGGEISRIMLALKSVLADVDSVGCLIFDEIDSGVGGEVALSIGEHLKSLSRNKQVLSITHLASIASCGENHLKVIKSTDGTKTKTEVVKLQDDQRVREIARMLSGECNEASLNHAKELLGIC
ncbi:DNA repair protein RecN [Thiospirochaeta perfilievii]|uniref:DNA repair protein RecN n=1 Tax=Thiospirochaeta perfilievii TaxID=252967 RepID=UPI0016592663|nr:DNA repair protein RecN [Thiospirochaeta perfilievii]